MSNIRYYTDGEQATADTLNRPIKDLELISKIPSKEDFFKRADDNLLNLGLGAAYTNIGYENHSNFVPISGDLGTSLMTRNSGLSVNHTNKIWVGGDETSAFMQAPTLQVRGINLRISGSNESYSGSSVDLPPAPNDYKFIGHEATLVYVEIWFEKVSDLDFVYPHGAVQFNQTSARDVRIATVVPDHFGDTTDLEGNTVNIKDVYSLFGEWQEPGAIIGRGWRWSTLSDSQKTEIINDPTNNLFIDGDEIVQVRYRFKSLNKGTRRKVINWGENNSGHLETGYNNDGDIDNNDGFDDRCYYLHPQGKKYTDWQTKGSSAFSYPVFSSSENYSTDIPEGFPGCYQAVKGSDQNYTDVIGSEYGEYGKVYAVMVCKVKRGNQGIFHRFLNPAGIAEWYGDFDLNREGSLWVVRDRWTNEIVNGLTSTNKSEAQSWLFNDLNKGWAYRLTAKEKHFSKNIIYNNISSVTGDPDEDHRTFERAIKYEDDWRIYTSNSDGEAEGQFELITSKTIRSWGFSFYSDSSGKLYNPETVLLYGSNDGTNWTLVDTHNSDYTLYSDNYNPPKDHQISIVDNPDSYKHYKVHCTVSAGNNDVIFKGIWFDDKADTKQIAHYGSNIHNQGYACQRDMEGTIYGGINDSRLTKKFVMRYKEVSTGNYYYPGRDSWFVKGKQIDTLQDKNLKSEINYLDGNGWLETCSDLVVNQTGGNSPCGTILSGWRQNESIDVFYYDWVHSSNVFDLRPIPVVG